MGWEYRIMSGIEIGRGKQYENQEAYLNAMGAEGWELVAATSSLTVTNLAPLGAASGVGPPTLLLYLKRPKP